MGRSERRATILELLRTRNLGGGQQGVMEWHDSRPGSEIPLSGDHFTQAFGVGADDEPYVPTAESRSRDLLERAILVLRDYDPAAYLAINTIFDRDVGGYRDLEFFGERAPLVVAEAERGIDRLVWLLPALYARPGRAMMEHEALSQYTRNRAVVATWGRGKAAGAKSKDIVVALREAYGISERRIYQILDQEGKSGD